MPCQQLGGGVFVLQELHVVTCAVATSNVAAAGDVRAVHDVLHEAALPGLIHFLEVGQDKVVAVPVKETTDAPKAIFGVGRAGVCAGIVTPKLKAVDVDGGTDTVCAEDVVRLLLVEKHLGAVVQAKAGNAQALIGGGFVGDAVVARVEPDGVRCGHASPSPAYSRCKQLRRRNWRECPEWY